MYLQSLPGIAGLQHQIRIDRQSWVKRQVNFLLEDKAGAGKMKL